MYQERKINLCNQIRKRKKDVGSYVEGYNEMILDLLEETGFYPQNKEDQTKIN